MRSSLRPRKENDLPEITQPIGDRARTGACKPTTNAQICSLPHTDQQRPEPLTFLAHSFPPFPIQDPTFLP